MMYRLCLNGCDDTTAIEMDLTDAELAFVQRIAVLSERNSTYVCMPTMRVETIDEREAN